MRHVAGGTPKAIPGDSPVNSRLLLLYLHQKTLRNIRSEEANGLFLEEYLLSILHVLLQHSKPEGDFLVL